VTGDLLLLVLLVGVPAAVITAVLVVCLAAEPRRHWSPPVGRGLVDGTGRQALVSAWQAHVRIAALEDRIRHLEQHTGADQHRGGAA
jgi:hypothetical protein